jgi:hypothetical protein
MAKNKTPEEIADELYAEGKFWEAADEYAKALRPYRGYKHEVGTARKQLQCLKQIWKASEPQK